MRALRINKDIRNIEAGKCSCTVMLDEFKYGDKLKTVLESGISEALFKNPTAKYEMKVQKLFPYTELLSIPI
jgi:hypothetical protein